MDTVVATIVVDFTGDSGSSHLSCEVDSRAAGLNHGRTQFRPGMPVYLLVFKTDDVEITAKDASYGTLQNAWLAEEEKYIWVEEWLTFANTNTATLEKPYVDSFSYEWYGRSLGVLDPAGMGVTAESSGVASAKVKYRTKFIPMGITSPPSINGKTEFNIVVYIAGVSDA